jgi:hypothetical protein
LGNTDIAPVRFPGLSVGEMEKNSVALHKLTMDLQWINREKHFFFVYMCLAEYITFVFFTSEVHIKRIPLHHANEKIMK